MSNDSETTSQLEDELEIFHGELSPVAAHVYVRLGTIEGGGDWRLEGQLSGPVAAAGQTLPVRVRLRDLGSGPNLLAAAILPDPCYWSTDRPAWYQLDVELVRDGRSYWKTQRRIGFRGLGTTGNTLRMHSRRWVLRGVAVHDTWPDGPGPFREASAAAVITNPNCDFCDLASREGVLVVASLGNEADLPPRLRRLAAEPCVVIVLLESPGAEPARIRAAAQNILLGQQVAPGADPPAEWADVVFQTVEASQTGALRCQRDPAGRPTVAVHELEQSMPIDAARAACDRLQRELAPQGDFAGYVTKLPDIA